MITGDKGLAGAYNHNVLKLTEQEIAKGGEIKLFYNRSGRQNVFCKKGHTV